MSRALGNNLMWLYMGYQGTSITNCADPSAGELSGLGFSVLLGTTKHNRSRGAP